MSDKNKVAIITGGTRGIGYGIATCLANKGFDIVIASTNEKAAQTSAAAIAKEAGVEALGIACDVTQQVQIDAMIEQTLTHFGQIDILVNNAGICPFVDIMEIDEAVFRKTLDTNLTGAFLCTQRVARKMISREKGGRIIFITSLCVNVAGATLGDYAASKAGMHMLMKSFAIALGPHGITCNAVAPGMILTDMTRHHWEKPENAEFIKGRVPAGRIGTPEDIGNAVAMLCSDESSYINGVGLIVDGGHQTVCT
ncbi:MAG: SDR family oxidoreductase [Phycisphaeraceae bacterium]|nr:SDR family oxidoreductase [Phycisphaeraceae bacterium]